MQLRSGAGSNQERVVADWLCGASQEPFPYHYPTGKVGSMEARAYLILPIDSNNIAGSQKKF